MITDKIITGCGAGGGGVHGDRIVKSLKDGHEVVIGLCGQYNAA